MFNYSSLRSKPHNNHTKEEYCFTDIITETLMPYCTVCNLKFGNQLGITYEVYQKVPGLGSKRNAGLTPHRGLP
jgi:hypothetical protein